MKQPVTGFFKDEKGDWTARLKCGHTQHVRHNPPWQLRPWVVTKKGRQKHLGMELECLKCDRKEPVDFNQEE